MSSSPASSPLSVQTGGGSPCASGSAPACEPRPSVAGSRSTAEKTAGGSRAAADMSRWRSMALWRPLSSLVASASVVSGMPSSRARRPDAKAADSTGAGSRTSTGGGT